MTTVLTLAAFALLFALAGLVPLRGEEGGCGGDCGACGIGSDGGGCDLAPPSRTGRASGIPGDRGTTDAPSGAQESV